MIQQLNRRELYSGAFIGLALGDALGASVDGQVCSKLDPPQGITGGGRFQLSPGEWTDETSISMCISESLLDTGGFKAENFDAILKNWYHNSYWSCRDFCFGISDAMRDHVTERQCFNHQFDGPEILLCAGIITLYQFHDPQKRHQSLSELSHFFGNHEASRQSAVILAEILERSLYGEDKSSIFDSLLGNTEQKPASGEYLAITESICHKSMHPKPFLSAPERNALSVFLTALWAFAAAKHFKDGALKLASLGGASESACAVYGLLAGAYFGIDGIPDNWLRTLSHRKAIEDLGARVWKASLM